MRILFIQKFIDFLRGKSTQKLPFLEAAARKIYDLKSTKKLKTIILGSSHLEVGYIAKEGEINFATTAQDLYYSYNIYKKINRASVKNIVISYSYFSSWAHILMGRNRDYAALFKAYFNIGYQDKDIAKENKLYIKEFKYNLSLKKELSRLRLTKRKCNYGNFQCYPENYSSVDNYIEGAKIKKAFFEKSHDQLYYLEKLLEDTKNNSQKLYIILTPMHEEVFEYIPNKNELFNEMYHLTNKFKHCVVLDYYQSNLFNNGTYENFYNFHHLNLVGAKKLTKAINKIIYQGAIDD